MNLRIDQPHAQNANSQRADVPTRINSEIRLCRIAEDLNVEIVGPLSLLPYRQKCAIRFAADGTVTLLLGMRAPALDHASPYFMNILVSRLGIPVERARLYYTGAHPAVRQTVCRSRPIPSRDRLSTAIAEIGDLIEVLCDRVIEQGRHFLASSFEIRPAEIDFQAAVGRFIIPGRRRYADILELGCARETVHA